MYSPLRRRTVEDDMVEDLASRGNLFECRGVPKRLGITASCRGLPAIYHQSHVYSAGAVEEQCHYHGTLFLRRDRMVNERRENGRNMMTSRRLGEILEKCYFCLNQYETICPLQQDEKDLEGALKCPHQRLPQTPGERAKVL